MVKCTLDREKVGYLNSIIKEKNNLSLLNRYPVKNFSVDNMYELEETGLVDSNGNILETARPAIDILSNPYAVARLTFTGGVGTYENNINYDRTFLNNVSFTVTPNSISIDDQNNPQNIIKILENFVGKSDLKSINFTKKLNVAEALVIAAMMDMERKSSLRAFADEIHFTGNSYNSNMIWRIMNSTSSSIQWFVFIINEVIGEHVPLSQQQVQEAIEQLSEKGLVTKHGGQYQLSSEVSLLSNRMIIVDNILSVQTSKQDDTGEILSYGFTCIQSGVHDLLFLDYNGKEIIFETISSVRLIDYLERFLNCETYFKYI
jgi:DNA-binding MarR family transcriptional regulator